MKGRRKIVLSIFFFFLILGGLLSWLLPKKYTGEAAVVVDVKSPDPIAGMVLPGMMSPAYMVTQMDIVRSEKVARKVISRLKMNESTEVRQQWQDDTDGAGSLDAWLSDLLLKNLTIVPSKESNVMYISYVAVDPNFAAAMANAFVQSYLETTVELRVEPAKMYGHQFDEQARSLREKLEQAQAKLSEYQSKNGLIATDERLDVESARLADLSNQLVGMQVLSAESTSRNKESNSSSPEVLANPVVAGLRADISRLEAKLKELQERFGSSYPAVQETKANIAEMYTKLDAEIGRVKSSNNINNNVNKYKENQVAASLAQQREKLLKLKDQRDVALMLQKDVDSAQRSYDAVLARLSLTGLESQSSQTNVSVLKNASPPFKASFPNPLLFMGLAIVFGGTFAVVVPLILELRNRRVRVEEDVLRDVGELYLGKVPKLELKPKKIAEKRFLGLGFSGGGSK